MNIRSTVTAVVAATTLASCGGGGSDPADVAQDLLTALFEQDAATALENFSARDAAISESELRDCMAVIAGFYTADAGGAIAVLGAEPVPSPDEPYADGDDVTVDVRVEVGGEEDTIDVDVEYDADLGRFVDDFISYEC